MVKKKKAKKVEAKKSSSKTSVTTKTVKKLIDEKFGEVNARIDRILLAIAKSKSVKGL